MSTPTVYNCRCSLTPLGRRLTIDTEKRDALLQAVYASPEDDVPRLVYADWLEENGSAPLAVLIRRQCESREWAVFPPGQPATFHLSTVEGSAYPDIAGAIYTETATVADAPPVRDVSLMVHRGFVAGLAVPSVTFWTGQLCQPCMGRGWHTELQPSLLRSAALPIDPDRYHAVGGMRVWPCRLCGGRGGAGGIGWMAVATYPLLEPVDTGRRPYPHLVRDHVLWYRATPTQEAGGRLRNSNPADACLLPGRVFDRLRRGRRVTEEVLVGTTFEALRTGRNLGPPGPSTAAEVVAYPVTEPGDAPLADLSAALLADARWQNTPIHDRNPKEFFSLRDLYR